MDVSTQETVACFPGGGGSPEAGAGLGLCWRSEPKGIHFVWNYHKGVFPYPQPAGPALLDTVFLLPRPSSRKHPFWPSLDDAFPLTPLNPHPQPKEEPTASLVSVTAAPGSPSSTPGQTLRRRRNQSSLSWPAPGLPVQVFVAGLPADGRAAAALL